MSNELRTKYINRIIGSLLHDYDDMSVLWNAKTQQITVTKNGVCETKEFGTIDNEQGLYLCIVLFLNRIDMMSIFEKGVEK